MILAIASGKGGTGKTTIATSLAVAVADEAPLYLDCDVEAPNAHIFLSPTLERSKPVNLPIPLVDEGICDGCGRCAEVCQYHAIVSLDGKVLVFPELCHGCGSCMRQCPHGAIEEIPHQLGLLEAGVNPDGIHFARGTLDIGQPMAVPIIRALKQWHPFGDMKMVIRDAPPGVSCPVVETLTGADFVLLVTEPTPFGLHDLQLAVQLANELELPMGVVVNRDGIGDQRVDEYCQSVGLPVLMRIPFDEQIGKSVARGETLVEDFPKYRSYFIDVFSTINVLISENASKKQTGKRIMIASRSNKASGP
jgi:MinD superfamily P-loop ATPase